MRARQWVGLVLPCGTIPNLSTVQGLPTTDEILAGENDGAVWEDSMDDLAMAAEDMELRCVLAVVRHGDRTPKQKMKMVVNQARAP